MMRRPIRWFGGLLVLLSMLPFQTHAQTTQRPEVMDVVGLQHNRVAAATVCGTFENLGGTWSKIVGLETAPIDELVQLQDGTLLTFANGLQRRASNEAWQRVTGVSETLGGKLATNPAATRAYLAAWGHDGQRFYRSEDSGRTWTAMSRSNTPDVPRDMAVVIDPAGGAEALLVLDNEAGGSILRVSRDGGATFQPLATYTGAIRQAVGGKLFVDVDGTTFYVTTLGMDNVRRLYRGTVNGSELVQITLPPELAQRGVSALVSYHNRLVIANGPNVFFNGSRFVRYEQGLDGASVNALHVTFGGHAGITVRAATNKGVFVGNPDASEFWQDNSQGMTPCGQGNSPYAPVPPFADTPDRRFFLATGHTLALEFKTFWERNGGLPVFGYPLSEEFSERNADLGQNFTTQYLERERFEFHPENQAPYRVLLGRLGDELLAAKGRDWRKEGGNANPFPGTRCEAFAVGSVERTVCGPFLNYWRTHGLEFDSRRGASAAESLALFGLPLTAPKMETNPDGQSVITQWFERARFEYHPDKPEPYKVLLGRLGAQVLKTRGAPVP